MIAGIINTAPPFGIPCGCPELNGTFVLEGMCTNWMGFEDFCKWEFISDVCTVCMAGVNRHAADYISMQLNCAGAGVLLTINAGQLSYLNSCNLDAGACFPPAPAGDLNVAWQLAIPAATWACHDAVDLNIPFLFDNGKCDGTASTCLLTAL